MRFVIVLLPARTTNTPATPASSTTNGSLRFDCESEGCNSEVMTTGFSLTSVKLELIADLIRRS